MNAGAHPTPDRIDAFLDGELSREEREAFRQHLAACPACTAVLEQRREFFGLIGGLPELPAPGDAAPAIVAALQRRVRARLVEWLLLPQMLVAAALLAFALPDLAERAAGLTSFDALSQFEAMSAPEDLLSSPWNLAREQVRGLPNLDGWQPWPDGGLEIATAVNALRWSRQVFALPEVEALPAWTWWGVVAAAGLLWLLGNGILLQSSSRRAATES